MKSFEQVNNDEKELILQKLEMIMDEWKKVPDSLIDANEYKAYNNESLEIKKKNKFRVSYFHSISGYFMRLSKYLDDNDRQIFQNKLDSIIDKINEQRMSGLLIKEDNVDEIDKFAKNLIEKVKSSI